jgi:5-methylcytosine-specific restriction endonuclease McrA
VSNKEKVFECKFCCKAFSTIQGRCQHQKICRQHPDKQANQRITQLETKCKELEQTIETMSKQYHNMSSTVVSLTASTSTGSTSSSSTTTQINAKKKKIPFNLRKHCWNEYVGSAIGSTKCLCCQRIEITQLEFECGHVIAEANGGELNISNLRPICRSCNGSMGICNMRVYAKETFGVDLK